MVIYVSAPKTDIKDICALICRYGHTPIAPDLYFPIFTYEDFRVQNAELMNLCDYLWVVGDIDKGMQEEITTARGLLIPVRQFSGIEAVKEKLKTLKQASEETMLHQPEADVQAAKSYTTPEKATSKEKHSNAVHSSRPRSFGEIMCELSKVSTNEYANEALAYAMVAARSIQSVTHIDRHMLEDILYLYKYMLMDMDKIQLTAEEYATMVKEAPTSLSFELKLPKELVELVLRLEE